MPAAEQAQAAYMLGRILQQSIEKPKDRPANKEKYRESLALFTNAKTYPSLRTNSLWHISEIATIYGEEKIVRGALKELLNDAADVNVSAAVQYSLAQSYLRAHEVDKATEAFKKIRTDFPMNNYTLGSAYYLGTLDIRNLSKNIIRKINKRSI